MAAMTAALVGMALIGAYQQSQAQKMQGDYQKQMSDTNSEIANLQASDAIRRGDKSAANYQKQIKGMIGSQRANFGAQGIEVDAGSAADVQKDTEAIGTQDVLQIRNNAWREAWGYQAQALDSSGRGNFAQMAGNNDSRNSLLIGGLKAADYYNNGSGSAKTSGKDK